MRLIVEDRYQCPKCFVFFDGPHDHVKCKKDWRPIIRKKSLNSVDADPDAYSPSWKADN